jgi:SAM-dependent methyltransferase
LNVQSPPTQREYWNGRVGDEWAAHADRIDMMMTPLTEAALSAANFQRGERVLDIGCGSGATSLAIARRVGAEGAVTGVDLSSQLLALARERAGRSGMGLEFVQADAGAASFAQSFDAAFSRFGVMFFEAPVVAFAHIRTLLRADGRLTFVCWRPLKENIWSALPIEIIQPLLTAPLPTPDPDAPGPFALADEAKLQRTLREAGWRDIVVTPWGGDILIGGGGTLEDAADFMMKIGPCARAVADQNLDRAVVKQRLIERLTPLYANGGVALPAACWVTTARA